MLAILMNLGFAGQEVGIQNIDNYSMTMNFQTFTTGGDAVRVSGSSSMTWYFRKLLGRV